MVTSHRTQVLNSNVDQIVWQEQLGSVITVQWQQLRPVICQALWFYIRVVITAVNEKLLSIPTRELTAIRKASESFLVGGH
jgi:hypothetical protein